MTAIDPKVDEVVEPPSEESAPVIQVDGDDYMRLDGDAVYIKVFPKHDLDGAPSFGCAMINAEVNKRSNPMVWAIATGMVITAIDNPEVLISAAIAHESEQEELMQEDTMESTIEKKPIYDLANMACRGFIH